MKRHSRLASLLALIALFAASAAACVSFPEEYVPPEKIVYLRQPFYLVPVRYPAESAEPYAWDVDPPIDPVNPGILTLHDFNAFLKPDLVFDARVYKETKAHLLLMRDDPVYNALKAKLEAIDIAAPAPRALAKGEQTEKYSNGTGYAYPEAEGATIVYLANGDVKIVFPDGRTYFQMKNGDYFEKDGRGAETCAFFARDGAFRVRLPEGLYSQSPAQRRLETTDGEIMKTDVPTPQFVFIPALKKYRYSFFVDSFEGGKIRDIALMHESPLRYDYLPEEDIVMATDREKESVVIGADFRKSHRFFNVKTRKTEEVYSLFYPEGVRIKDLQAPLASAEVVPNWPEGYLEKNIGPFRFLYVKRDEPLLAKLDVKKLNAAYAAVPQAAGLSVKERRVVILPPDLASYRKLHARRGRETLSWYPSGFAGMDLVVMWPPSLPRYEGERGAAYFWETEFYDILAHELVHLAVGEATGIFSPLPVWLNEGLAVYAESRFSPAAKKYWDVSFAACLTLGKLLSWDDVAVNPTAFFPADDARTHYAQSYKMVGYLMEKYGPKNLRAYLASFKIPYEKIPEADVKASYKENFARIFKTSWEENASAFEKYCREGKIAK